MRLIAAVAAAAGLAACGLAPSASSTIPDVTLPTLSGAQASLRACATSQCVIAYVAPWCPHCRATTAGILELRDLLWKKGVLLRVVVGMDQPAALRDYAKSFGPNTMLDADKRFQVSGVPHFFVTDAQGRLSNDFAGTPHDNATGEELGRAFGLL